MKRSRHRESPPARSKRSRSRVRRHYDDSSDERVTPDRARRRSSRGRSTSPRRYSPDRDDYRRDAEKSYPSYKVLCVSALHPKASDEVVKETLYHEYKKYGDFNIRISDELGERVAYICFRHPEDARDARHSKPRVVLYEKVAIVEPVYERARSPRRSRSLTPEYDAHLRRSPPPDSRYLLPPESIYGRGYIAPVPIPHRDPLRRDAPPMIHDFYARGPPLHPLHPHPLPHHLPPAMHSAYGPPRHMMFPRFKPPHEYRKSEKKEKFPNYLHHIPPEDDPLATRTLFVGNLEVSIHDDELHKIFSRYGVVEDIDIKKPPPGTGNAFAFVRFQNLDMAHAAKVELSGQYIGKFQCKIGYGKALPSVKIWVGGLGSWTSISQLEREFDRFGAIQKIEYVKGDTQAYILYNSIDAATAAVKEMRGFPLGGPEHKLRIDFADVTSAGGKSKSFSRKDPASSAGDFRARDDIPGFDAAYDAWGDSDLPSPRSYRNKGRDSYSRLPPGEYDDDWPSRSHDYDSHRGIKGDKSPRRHSGNNSDSDSELRRANGILGAAKTLADLAWQSTSTWSGGIVLKNSLIPLKFYLTDGDASLIDSLMKNEEGKHILRITQRLRLDQPKLEDVSKRIASSSSYAIFLGLSSPNTSIKSEDVSMPLHSFKYLMSYLKQKDAAGVISLITKDSEVTGVLYVFPPCSFSTELLKRTAHSVTEDALKEDHVMVVVLNCTPP
nr:PREDICTED: putative RNA-binding protein 15 [Bemisia tabaci]